MSSRAFQQVDVFTHHPYRGNPVAVVLDGDGLTDAGMQRFARWTNLSETTFVQRPTAAGADYRVRIFTPAQELPFAGHPTLGTCHAWLDAGNAPADPGVIVQECGIGLVTIARTGNGLAFAAPQLLRSGPVDPGTLDAVAAALGVAPGDIVDAAWADNGPGWIGVLLADAATVLALRPGYVDQKIGVAGPYADGGTAYEVRAFFPVDGAMREDPVTGSLNASLAQWLTGTGRFVPPYLVRQGTALGRDGRVEITADEAGRLWVAGGTVTCVRGTVEL